MNRIKNGASPFVKQGQNVVGNQNEKDLKNLWNYPDGFKQTDNNSNISNNPDVDTMKDGGPMSGNTRYQIHHIIPIGRGGQVYNFNNLAIVTPLYHCSMLEYQYHQGGGKKQ